MNLLGFDSLDALRASLTANLGLNSSGVQAHSELSPVIGRLLLDEARENERRIALVRVTLAGALLVIGGLGSLTGEVSAPRAAFLAAIAWFAAAGGFHFVLRRGLFRNWFRRAAPTADALSVIIGALLATQPDGPVTTRAAVTGGAVLMCAFIVFTGALRLTRLSALYAACLALVAFVLVAARVQLPPLAAVGIIAGLVATSVLAGRVTDVIRRVVTIEVDRLQMERQVDRTNARLAEAQAASSAREDVLRIVAHDLRNPLGTLLMSADLLGEQSLSDETRVQQVRVVKRVGARMNRLIRDLLDVARIDSGRLSVDEKATPVATLIENAVELMRPLAGESGLSLDVSMDASLPDVSADVERINQVFSNLVGNAIKFTPVGGRITLGATAADGFVWFSVTDTGPGIPQDQLAKLFGPFWQAKKSDTRGIGLGLTIAKGIVEAHTGKIGVSSDVGVGTRFWFGLRAVAS